MRSFNNKSGKGSRLVITLYAKELRPAAGEHENQLLLAGVLCKPPVVRAHPAGPGHLRFDAGGEPPVRPADYLPCTPGAAWPGGAGHWRWGTACALRGGLQSRAYTKVDHGVSEVRTAYEVSVMKLEPVET